MGKTGRHGVAIALSEATQFALLARVPVSPRLANARLKRATVNLTVVAVFVPTLDAAEELKESFYDDLQETIDSAPSGDMLIVAGDWDTRPDPVDTATQHILGITLCFQHPHRHLVA